MVKTMTIGEKIKKLRTDKLMSQSELAGSEITRNMLSQIEHGSAMPSLSTVNYIASRLNVSPGFLLANEEDERIYLKNAAIDDIKKAYVAKSFELCYNMCKRFNAEDDEITLILAECSLRVGIEAFCRGELHSAANIFDETIEYCKKSIYNTDTIVSDIRSYSSYMELISPTLTLEDLDEFGNKTIIPCSDDFAIYSSIISEAEMRGWNDVALLTRRLERLQTDSMYYLHIDSRLKIARGNYTEAYEILHELLYNESYALPEPMLYFVLCDIELCCKEIDDFKGAYEYSSSKISLMQKLLS